MTTQSTDLNLEYESEQKSALESAYDPAGHQLHLPACPNLRELGGYDTPDGPTRTHRFLRCGGTRSLRPNDLDFLRAWGVRRALDLRSRGEAPHITCAFSQVDWVAWENVPLFDYDLSAPSMLPVRETGSYLVSGYLQILSNTRNIARVMSFLSQAKPDECALFHCAAGMDRTGMVSMLLLGLAGVSRSQVIADYAYSFGVAEDVDNAVAHINLDVKPDYDSPSYVLDTRIHAIATVYDTVLANYGSIRAYLRSCDIPEYQLYALRAHLLA